MILSPAGAGFDWKGGGDSMRIASGFSVIARWGIGQPDARSEKNPEFPPGGGKNLTKPRVDTTFKFWTVADRSKAAGEKPRREI